MGLKQWIHHVCYLMVIASMDYAQSDEFTPPVYQILRAEEPIIIDG